jgi:hypothetical protein
MICLQYNDRCVFMNEDGEVLSEYRTRRPLVSFSTNTPSWLCLSDDCVNLLDPFTGSVIKQKIINGLITTYPLYDSRFIGITEFGVADRFVDFDSEWTNKLQDDFVTVSPDGSLVVLTKRNGKIVEVFDTKLNASVKTILIDDILYNARFSNDGMTLIVHIFKTPRTGSFLIVRETGETWIRDIGDVLTFAISPNGETIVCGNSNNILMLRDGFRTDLIVAGHKQVEFIDDDVFVVMTNDQLLFYDLNFALQKTIPLPSRGVRGMSIRPRSYAILL